MSLRATNKRLTLQEAIDRGLINRGMWRTLVGASRVSPAEREELVAMADFDGGDAHPPHPEPEPQACLSDDEYDSNGTA
jgi:hypothetical protein